MIRVALIAAVALASLLPGPARAAEGGPICAASATITGSHAGPVTEALRRRGVTVPPAAGCPGPAVNVDFSYAATLLVEQGNQGPHAVPDVETAALLIETWVRADLIDPLLAARRGPPIPAPPPPPSARPITLDLALDGAWTEDVGAWGGLRAEGCIALGWICPGVRLRALVDPGFSGESRDADVWRLGLGVMASADAIYGDSRAGVGLGVVAVRIDEPEGQADVAGAPLLEVKLGHALPLSDRWALDISVAGDMAFWPRGGRDGGGRASLPGLPRFFVIGGLGLRWRLP